jgi:hypothetical protein
MVWCGLLKKYLTLLFRLSFTYKNYPRHWTHFESMDELQVLLDKKCAQVLSKSMCQHIIRNHGMYHFTSVTFCRLIKSSSRKMAANKPQCTVLYQELLELPSHCEVIIEKQTRIFQSLGRSTTTQSQEIQCILLQNFPDYHNS